MMFWFNDLHEQQLNVITIAKFYHIACAVLHTDMISKHEWWVYHHCTLLLNTATIVNYFINFTFDVKKKILRSRVELRAIAYARISPEPYNNSLRESSLCLNSAKWPCQMLHTYFDAVNDYAIRFALLQNEPKLFGEVSKGTGRSSNQHYLYLVWY